MEHGKKFSSYQLDYAQSLSAIKYIPWDGIEVACHYNKVADHGMQINALWELIWPMKKSFG